MIVYEQNMHMNAHTHIQIYIPCMMAFYYTTNVHRACCEACGSLLLTFSSHHSVSKIEITRRACVCVGNMEIFAVAYENCSQP